MLQYFQRIKLSPLWLTGKSQPNSCDPVFLAWKDAGNLTLDLIWQRINLAINNSQIRLVNYLKTFLDADNQVWVDRWLKVYAHPELILQHEEFTSIHPWRENILIFGIKQLSRKYPRQTPRAWITLKQRYQFNKSQQSTARHAVALAYLRFAGPNTLNVISDIDGVVDVNLQRKRIIIALTRSDWRQVISRINALPQQEQAKPQWQYWKGRAFQKLRQHNQAQAILKSVAKDRTYYAFLAADHINHDYYLVNRPLQIEPKLLKSIAQNQITLRAQELRTIGRIGDARSEWHWLIKDLNPSGLQAAANLANVWHWHDQAIITLARSDFWDDLDLRFPLKH
ncbi:hypothetical protein TI03_04290, partial [Achromatium sp. WMS1]